MLCLGLVVGLNFLVDPTGRWASLTYPVRGFAQGHHLRLKLAGVKACQAKVVFLGSSRMQWIETPLEIEGDRAYNFGFSDADIRTMSEITEQLVAEGNIEHLYLSLGYAGFINPVVMDSFPYMQYTPTSLALDCEALVGWKPTRTSCRLLGIPGFSQSHHPVQIDYRTGQIAVYHVTENASDNQAYLDAFTGYIAAMPALLRENAFEKSFFHLQEIIDRCADADVKLTLFIYPLSPALDHLYRVSGQWENLTKWRMEVARRHPVIDLLDDASLRRELKFADPVHIAPDHSPLILTRIIGQP